MRRESSGMCLLFLSVTWLLLLLWTLNVLFSIAAAAAAGVLLCNCSSVELFWWYWCRCQWCVFVCHFLIFLIFTLQVPKHPWLYQTKTVLDKTNKHDFFPKKESKTWRGVMRSEAHDTTDQGASEACPTCRLQCTLLGDWSRCPDVYLRIIHYISTKRRDISFAAPNCTTLHLHCSYLRLYWMRCAWITRNQKTS